MTQAIVDSIQMIALPNGANTSGVMTVGRHGVNISIADLTTGTVYLEIFDGTDWRQYPNLTYTTDYYDYCRIHMGAQIRVVTDSVTGNPTINVVPRG